jgi:AcrR family transcriptional regulator
MVAARRAKVLDRKRRSPQRSGSRDTVEVIFEAAARILQGEGKAALNTNRIAEKAGVSIGAIYGYFPNKRAILLAMARRELDAMRDRVHAALVAVDDPERDPVRRAVRALIKGYGARGKVRRILMETLFAEGGTEDMARPVSEIAQVLAAHDGEIMPARARKLSPVALYVLTRTVDGLVRTATYENVPFLASAEFEDEIVRLVSGYLAA